RTHDRGFLTLEHQSFSSICSHSGQQLGSNHRTRISKLIFAVARRRDAGEHSNKKAPAVWRPSGPKSFTERMSTLMIDPTASRGKTASDVLTQLRISEAYRSLTGADLRRTGIDRYRVRATWRDGDGLNVALDDSRGAWYDHVANEGGGILDLIIRVNGGTRRGALRWAAECAGVDLDDLPISHEDRTPC